jgi:twitching motility protein PilT
MDIKSLLQEAARQGASDLHLIQGLPPMLRTDGHLHQATLSGKSAISEPNPELEISAVYAMDDNGNFIDPSQAQAKSTDDKVVSAKDLKEAARELLTDTQLKTLSEEKDFDLAVSAGDFRFRVNFSYERSHLKIVGRVIPPVIPTLESIGMPSIIYDLLNLEQGLILVTGPTGSGKSTSMAAMVNHINATRSENVVTFEDPIEFVFESGKSIITQRQLGSDMPSFECGLKHVLRQDPNVIMVGEMRDLETIAAAITLAETGHLVLATLHTGSASRTIDRIIDIFPPHQQNQIKFQLSSILSAVISQRLLPRIGGGRVALREVMVRTSAIANLIRENKVAQINNAIETGAEDGMISISRGLKELYASGLISAEVAKAQLNESRF